MNSGKSESKNNCNIFDITSEQRVPKCFKPLEVIIKLEGSGEWPNDRKALQRVKTSFYIELCQRLSKQYDLMAHTNCDSMDVQTNKKCYAFQLNSKFDKILKILLKNFITI